MLTLQIEKNRGEAASVRDRSSGGRPPVFRITWEPWSFWAGPEEELRKPLWHIN